MGSDRARVSYDPSRHWRGVIGQQGRVTIEADWNEAGAIEREADRLQLLDVVGTSGTPGDGYRVAPVTAKNGSATGDLSIKQGILYVGGERMELPSDLDYAKQTDWIDNDGDPLWVAPAVPAGNKQEAVYLLLREQEVGAVEDPALLDVALGGPDTSARLRIVQRVVRESVSEPTCSGALGDLEDTWTRMGLVFRPDSMRLESETTLLVTLPQQLGASTPCQPAASGGYLGAENQLIRVQVASVDPNGKPVLVWGFDNASFLYRIAPTPTVNQRANTTTLTLESAPVDSYHQPVAGQAVEVLQAAALVSSTSSTSYVAATTGIVTTVADNGAYQPDTQQLVISTALGAPTTTSPQLFLRVWQDTIAYKGGAVQLGDTGVYVTLTSSSGIFHVGDYWQIAVRPGLPSTASQIYPERLLVSPQPPDGPRLWACQLATITWVNGSPTVTNCRQTFDNLVTLTDHVSGCCTVSLRPEDVDGGGTLQSLIDSFTNQGPTTICLQPGTYKLPSPLVIGAGLSDLTIQGCQGGVVFQAADSSSASFLLGLILLDNATAFTLRGIELDLPLVPFSFGASAIEGLPEERQALLADFGRELVLSFGLYALGATDAEIADCQFSFAASDGNSFGAGILAAREVAGLEISGCRFVASEATTAPFSQLARGAEADPPYQVRVGYLQIPTRTEETTLVPVEPRLAAPEDVVTKAARAATAKAPRKGAAAVVQTPAVDTEVGIPTLTDAVFEDNVFDGLTVPLLFIGQPGILRIKDNIVRACYGGFWVVTASTTDVLTVLDRLDAGNADVWQYLVANLLTALADPVLLFASTIGRILPVSPTSTGSAGAIGSIAEPDTDLLQRALTLFGRLTSVAPSTTTTDATPAAAPAPASARVTKAAARTRKAAAAPKTVVTSTTTVQLPKKISDIFTDSGSVQPADVVPPDDPGIALLPRLEVTANQVDAILADSYSGASLLVTALDGTNASTVICTANRIRGRVELGATVSLHAVAQCTLSGNIVGNEIADPAQNPDPQPVPSNSTAQANRSLVLLPQLLQKLAAVAVTGNVLIGPAYLPARSEAAPFTVWDGLNTLLPYVTPA